MLIWILALLLVLSSVVLGYTWGAIRVGITTIGLLVACVLAVPVSPILYPMFNKLSLGTQVHAIFISPFIVMMVVMIIFKIIASTVHQKVDTHYKYHCAEYVQTLWFRTNERFGAALGLVNATIYLFIISTFIYVLAYPVSQLSSADKDSSAWQWLLKTSTALKNTKMDRAAAAFNPAPDKYYNVCDLLGTVYQNPLLIGRLTSYPPIMALGERDEFRPMFDEIAKDSAFAKKLFETPRPPFQELLGETSFHMIVTNKPFMKELFKLDFKDLSNYVATGASPKFEDKFLGRWQYNPDASVALHLTMMKAQNSKLKIVPKLRDTVAESYKNALGSVTLVGLVENQLVIKTAAANQSQTAVKGTWKDSGGGKYELTVEGGWGSEAEMRGNRLLTRFKIGNENRFVVFDKE